MCSRTTRRAAAARRGSARAPRRAGERRTAGSKAAPSTIAPEGTAYGNTTPQRIWQGTYTNTLTSRMLFEFGYSALQQPLGRTASRRATRRDDFIQVREQGGAIPGLCYRAISTLCGTGFATSTGWISANTWHANISYVTGSHNIKFGYNGLYDYDNQDRNYANSQGLVYQFNNGVPNQFWELSGQFKSQWRTRYDAFFAQDSWTRDRLTLQGALRYEHAWSYYPPESYIGGTRFIPYADDSGSQRRQLQRRHAASRSRLRPVRQRQDVAEGQLRQVCPAGAERRHLHRRRADLRHRHGRDAQLDRPQQQLRRRLQPVDVRAHRI